MPKTRKKKNSLGIGKGKSCFGRRRDAVALDLSVYILGVNHSLNKGVVTKRQQPHKFLENSFPGSLLSMKLFKGRGLSQLL